MHLTRKIRKELKLVAEPHKAAKMQSYMKSEMPYLGAQSPRVKDVCKRVYKGLEFGSQKELEEATRDMWDNAKYREERYCAIALTGIKGARHLQKPGLLKLYRHMIVTGAWWDYVDALAIHHAGLLLKLHAEKLQPTMLQWSEHKDIWLRRTAIISQISFKEEFDIDHLFACIEPSIERDEFFLRKGIGWALRDLAWRDPKKAIAYVRKNKDRLSGLSKREALKNVLKKGMIKEIP